MIKLDKKALFLKLLSDIKDFKETEMKQLSLRLSEIIHRFLTEAKPSFSYQEVNNLAEDMKNEVLKYFSTAYEDILNNAISFIKTQLEKSTRPSETTELMEKVSQLENILKSLENVFSEALGEKVERNELVEKARTMLQSTGKLEEVQKLLEEKARTVKELQEQITSLREQNKKLEEELNSAREERERLEEAKGALDEKIADLERKLTEKDGEIKRLEKTIKDLSSSGDEIQKELLKLKDEISEKDLLVKKLEREIAEKEAEITRLKTSKSELSAELDKLKETLVKATANYEKAKEEMQKLSEYRERLATIFDKLSKHISTSLELRLLSFLMNLKTPLTIDRISKSLGIKIDAIKETLEKLETMNLVKIEKDKVIVTV